MPIDTLDACVEPRSGWATCGGGAAKGRRMLYAKHGRHKERVAAAAEGHLHWLTVLYGG